MNPVKFVLSCLVVLTAFPSIPAEAKKQKGFPLQAISPDTVIHEIVDQMPTFRGRPINPTLVQWISSQIRYPPDLIRRKVEGKVWGSFVVEPDRRISNIRILSSPDKGLSLEVLRVLRNMPPAWTPGIDSTGRAVRVEVAVPVNFRLD